MQTSPWVHLLAQNAPPGGTTTTQPAQATNGGSGSVASSPGAGLDFFLMMILMFFIMYIILIRPQNKQRRELEKKISQLRKGDRIVFGGGILGEVLNPEGKDGTMVVKIGEDVKIEILRGAITKVFDRA